MKRRSFKDTESNRRSLKMISIPFTAEVKNGLPKLWVRVSANQFSTIRKVL